MTQISTTLVLTFPSEVLTSMQRSTIQAAVTSALGGYTVDYHWHAENRDVGSMLPAVDTPGAGDVDVVCPVCQAELKLGAGTLWMPDASAPRPPDWVATPTPSASPLTVFVLTPDAWDDVVDVAFREAFLVEKADQGDVAQPFDVYLRIIDSASRSAHPITVAEDRTRPFLPAKRRASGPRSRRPRGRWTARTNRFGWDRPAACSSRDALGTIRRRF